MSLMNNVKEVLLVLCIGTRLSMLSACKHRQGWCLNSMCNADRRHLHCTVKTEAMAGARPQVSASLACSCCTVSLKQHLCESTVGTSPGKGPGCMWVQEAHPIRMVHTRDVYFCYHTLQASQPSSGHPKQGIPVGQTGDCRLGQPGLLQVYWMCLILCERRHSLPRLVKVSALVQDAPS
jgi:hypothetical protein